MSSENTDRPRVLVNPYGSSPSRPAVSGVTLGRFGAAAAGVLALAVPGVEASIDANGEVTLSPTNEVVFGDAEDVQCDVAASCMPAAYLWAAVPRSRPEVSPALVG